MADNFTLTPDEMQLIEPHLPPFGKQSRTNNRRCFAALLLAEQARISLEDSCEWCGVSVSAVRSRKSRLGTGAYRALLKAGAPAAHRLRAAYLDRADDSDTGKIMRALGFVD